MTALEQSEALHERARAFIGGQRRDDFEALACDIAKFQAEHIAPLAGLLHPATFRTADEIPALPVDAFRLRRIAWHDSDERCFETSGTTGGKGRHPLRTTATYRLAALTWARHMLLGGAQSMIALVAPEALAPQSSLGFMLARFAEAIGSASWHFDGRVIDVAGVRAAIADQPVLIAGTSFAFVHLLDAHAPAMALAVGSRVMQTGGFKGRSREVEANELRRQIATHFEIPETHVVGEYGMTELSSQLYQGGLVDGLDDDLYYPPPWLRVRAVDETTLEPVESGRPGLARFVDLANVDSAVAIVCADRIVEVSGGFRLLGRRAGAPPRGCSLTLEHLV